MLFLNRLGANTANISKGYINYYNIRHTQKITRSREEVDTKILRKSQQILWSLDALLKSYETKDTKGTLQPSQMN